MLKFDSRDTRYKKPFGAVAAGTTVYLKFPVSADIGATEVALIYRGAEEGKLTLKRLGDVDGYTVFTGAAVFNRFALGIQTGEFLAVQCAVIDRFSCINRTAYFCFLRHHFFTPKNTFPFQRVPVISRATAESDL